jgi:hypothetical protein
MSRLCSRCLLEPARRDGLGAACLRYQQRHGHPRPAALIVRHAERISYRAAIRSERGV